MSGDLGETRTISTCSEKPLRTDRVCSLTKEQIADIARLLLERTRMRLRPQDVGLEFTQEAVDLVAAEGFDPEFGARPLRRTIQRKVDNELSRMLLEGSLNPGDLGRGS